MIEARQPSWDTLVFLKEAVLVVLRDEEVLVGLIELLVTAVVLEVVLIVAMPVEVVI